MREVDELFGVSDARRFHAMEDILYRKREKLEHSGRLSPEAMDRQLERYLDKHYPTYHADHIRFESYVRAVYSLDVKRPVRSSARYH